MDEALKIIPTNITVNEAVTAYFNSNKKEDLNYTLSPLHSRAIFVCDMTATDDNAKNNHI